MEYHGFLDEASIFNSAFNQTQVQELFNDGVALDATTHSKYTHLLGYWRNDGVTTWQDRRGWSYLDFDGNGDFVNISSSLTPSSLTFSIWIATATDSSYRTFIQCGDLLISKSNGNKVHVNKSGSSGQNSTTSFVADVWTHIAVTADSSGTKVYRNGVLDLDGSAIAFTAGDILIGKYTGGQFTNGLISSVAFYSSVKSLSEIQSIYNAGINSSEASNSNLIGYWKFNTASTDANAIKDLSSNSNHGTVNGNPTLNDGNDGTVQGSPDSITIREGLNANRDALGFYFTNPSNNVLRLNGVDEHLKLPYTKSFDMGDNSFTVSAWVKTTLGVGASIKSILWARDNDNSFKGFEFQIDDSADRPRFIISDASGKECNGTSNSVESDKWHFVAVIVDKENGLAKLFLSESDGSALKCQTTTDISSKGNINATPDWYVGKKNNATDRNFTGIIDELMVHNIALTAFESDGTIVEAGDTVTSGELLKNYKFSKGKHKND